MIPGMRYAQCSRVLVFLCLCLSRPVHGQVLTRAQEIETTRDVKQASLGLEEPDSGEKRFVALVRNPLFEAIFGQHDGFTVGLGGMAAGAGFAAGPNWKRTELLDGKLNFYALARGSSNRSYVGSALASFTGLLDGFAQVDVSALHQNYSQLPYYGPGPDSRKTGRSAYRLEETRVTIQPALRPTRQLSVGAIGGFHAFNAGPGASDDFISTDAQFTPAQTPGIDRQGSFWKSGVFAAYDHRRGGTQPLEGTRVEAEYSRLSDRDLSAFSHGRLELDLEHYIPFFNDRRVIALHGHTTLTDARAGQSVPFYLQPWVGGPDTLRGFRPFRFRDANSFFLNGEYRWETSLGLDMALFADGGKVFPDWNQLNFNDFEGSFGLGFRGKMVQDLVMRLDIGVSREGAMVWLRFDNIF